MLVLVIFLLCFKLFEQTDTKHTADDEDQVYVAIAGDCGAAALYDLLKRRPQGAGVCF